jgi:hypothetical protein
MKVSHLSFALLLLVGCAAPSASRPGARFAITSGETHWETCFPGRAYTQGETSLMHEMRDQGATFPEIAAVLGGKPQDIRCWEARVHGRQREGIELARAAHK